MIGKFVKFFVLYLTMSGALVSAVAQHGTFENPGNGTFPPNYYGDTWTGKLVSMDTATNLITITNEKKGKTETFAGIMMPGVGALDKNNKPITGNFSIKPGDKVTLYYTTKGKDHTVVRIKLLDFGPNLAKGKGGSDNQPETPADNP